MHSKRLFFAACGIAGILTNAVCALGANAVILGWNNLGMHCMDSDYSVFSILPPYNTIQAQLIVNGTLVTQPGYTNTYEAVADPDGSINSTAIGKGNFFDFDALIYGVDLPPDEGLAGWSLPGISNVPQAMLFEKTNVPAKDVAVKVNWFRAEGIPLSPYDNAMHKNPYPLMRLVARDANNNIIATNNIVLPISDEMDCRACHASGTDADATPSTGWVWSANPERDYRLNILQLHDDHQFASAPTLYSNALAQFGFNSQGLYRSVVADGRPVLCASCHISEALATPGFPGVLPLTAAGHSRHATVLDPELGIPLDSEANRAACYRCHPGSTTKCLRGAMGSAIATDGSMAIQCQSCHGKLSTVGNPNRIGWFQEPDCQGCHTGTATHNNGQIRYDSVFIDTNGTVRIAVDQTFATKANIPAAGLSMYRFSAGHGGLQCEACHGSTHAEYPSSHRNDNLANIQLQGHAGVMVECTACHVTMPVNSTTMTGGPHGMHPVGQSWVSGHGDRLEGQSKAICQTCHGTDYKGTVLSRVQADRTLSAFGTKTFWRGFEVGCYTCHNGPNSDHSNPNSAPIVSNVSSSTQCGTPVAITLHATDANSDALTLRVVSQPEHGSVGISNNVATYFPDPGFVGSDTFTFAARDGQTDSNLGTGTVSVTQGPFTISAQAHAPPTYNAKWAVPFVVIAAPVNVNAAPSVRLEFWRWFGARDKPISDARLRIIGQLRLDRDFEGTKRRVDGANHEQRNNYD